jgi:sugar phosphate isomerase/epimerase
MIVFSAGSLYNYGLERCCRLASETGFDGLEIIVDHRWDTRQIDYLHQLQKDYHLPILSLHSPFVPDSFDGWGKTHMASIDRTVQMAEGVGASVVVAHLPVRDDREYCAWLLGDFQEYASRQRVKVAVENMPSPWRPWWLPYRRPHYSLNKFDYWERFPYLTLDTTHLGTMGLDVLATYDRLKERVAHVHLSNFRPDRREREHRLLEDGILPLDQLLGRLREGGYTGVISLELSPVALGAGDDELVKRNMLKSLIFCQRHFVPSLTLTPELEGASNAAC